jgi:surface antigen
MKSAGRSAGARWLSRLVVCATAVSTTLLLAPIDASGFGVSSAYVGQPHTISYQNLGYPWYGATAVDVAEFDWGYATCPSNDTACFVLRSTTSGATCNQGSSGCYGEADPWAYYLRNCTSFVAWYLANHNVPFSDFNFSTEGEGEARQWLQDAQTTPWNTRLTTGSNPEVGSVAVSVGKDHVMVVTAVNIDGTITVEEYNQDLHGDGDIQTASPSAMGVTGYIYYNNVPGSRTGSPTPTDMGNLAILLRKSSHMSAGFYRTSTGQIMFVTIGPNGHTYQDFPNGNGGWSGWDDFGAPAGVSLTSVTTGFYPNSSGQVMFVATGSNGRTYQDFPTNSGDWSGWDDFGAPAGVKLTSVTTGFYRNSSGQVMFVATGSNGRTYQDFPNGNGGWSGWDDFGAP